MPAVGADKPRGKKGKGSAAKGPSAASAEDAAQQRERQALILRGRLHDLMEQERSLSEGAMCDIEARWIAFLREARLKELVREIELLRRDFERALDRKTASIDMLVTSHEVAETQYRSAAVAHNERVSTLQAMHLRRTEDLDREFEAKMQHLVETFEREHAEVERQNQIVLSDLKLILDNMAAKAEQMERLLQEELSEAHETSLEKMEEEKKQVQNDLQRVNAVLRAELDARYKEFMSHAQTNMKEYMDKMKEDQDTAERIEAQLKKIDKLQESIATWRANIVNNGKEWEQRNTALRAEKEATARYLGTLKRRMSRWRETEAERLRMLVTNARTTEDALQGTATKAETLLRLMDLCRSLETERERAFAPDGAGRWIAADAVGESGSTAPGSTPADSIGTAENEWRLMETFWLRHNKVVLDTTALSKERVQLLKENETIKQLLKQYLDGITVSDAVMKAQNCLLNTTEKPVNLILASTGTAKVRNDLVYNTVVDGNTYVASVTRQLGTRH